MPIALGYLAVSFTLGIAAKNAGLTALQAALASITCHASAGEVSDKPLFFAVNSYTTGLSPAVMEYMLKTTLIPRFGGKTSCDEIGLPVSATGGVVPCGATAIWEE